MNSAHFVLNGTRMTLTPDAVRQRLVSVRPEQGQSVFVQIDGVEFPIKQAFSTATGVARDGFVTDTARRIFAKMGFIVTDKMGFDNINSNATNSAVATVPVSVDELNLMRTRIVWIMNKVDGGPGKPDEPVGRRLTRLVDAKRIPPDVAPLLRLIMAERALSVYQEISPSPEVSAAVRTVWKGILDWAARMKLMPEIKT